MSIKRKTSLTVLSNKILQGLSCFICLEKENKDQRLQYQPDYSYLVVDPRINFIKQVISIIFSQDNYQNKPFAFRLRHLNDWLIKTSSINFLTQMAWDCKTNCIFCYQKGNPPFMRVKQRISKAEIKTRLKYFNFKQQQGLVGGAICENDEVLNNPYITEILQELRKKDRYKLIEITTNGTALDRQLIKKLKKASPMQVVLSLNSADPEIRKWLMNDRRPEVAIASLPLLKRYQIPYITSIVVWPGLPFSDIKKTIRYAEQNDAYAVRLNLPGYTKFFSRKKLFDIKVHWQKTVKYFHALSRDYSVPILMVPHMYVQALVYDRVDLPQVIGTIKNSPAYDCGIIPGDLIKEINGQPIDSIDHAMNALNQCSYRRVKVKIKRDNSIFDLEIKDKAKTCYPYGLADLRKSSPFGFLLAERYLSHDDILDIGRLITVYDAKNVLLTSSTRARPFLVHLLAKYNIADESNANIHIITPKNIYFGGSIDAGDLLTVKDCIQAIKQYVKRSKPDLIILPSSPFNIWSRDLIGDIALDIEREIGIPVEFIYNKKVFN